MAKTAGSSAARSTSKKVAGLAGAAVSPVALFITEWARSNPGKAVALVLIWLVILMVVGFALDVWSDIRPTFVRRAAEAVKFRRETGFSYRQHYLRDITFRHRFFDVKWLRTQSTFPLELERVFVDLYVTPSMASADMIREVPDELREGRHRVWDFLEGVDGGTANRPRRAAAGAKLMLLGAPGSGKTALVKHIALTFAHGRSPRPNLRASRNLPILLFLQEQAEAITNNPIPKLSELVAGYQKEQREHEIPASWFDAELKRGRCLVMLDGLDEVADPDIRKKVEEWAERQMSVLGSNRFIVTSRPHGYRDNSLSAVTLAVRPFTNDQVIDFVHRWYTAKEIQDHQRDDAGVRQKAEAEASELLDRLDATPALWDLAVNPLLLTLIATVHPVPGKLPGRRVELYAKICEVCLGKRQQSKRSQMDLTAAQKQRTAGKRQQQSKGDQSDLTPAEKQRVLESLAWKMMISKKRKIAKSDACTAIQKTLRSVNERINPDDRITPGDFLVGVENDSSLLLEKEAGGSYEFAHQTFQEFLAACHAQQDQKRIELLTRSIGDEWWAECIRFFAANGDATPILRVCISRAALDPEALALAMECMEEAAKEERAGTLPGDRALGRQELEQELDRIVQAGLNQTDPAKRKPIAEALLKVRLARMHRLDEDRYIDPELLSHAEYQLFLDERRAHGEDRRPIHWNADLHWNADQFREGQARTPIFGLSFPDAVAFCEWLTERDGRQHRFRLPTIDENASTEAKRAPEERTLAAWTLVSASEPISAAWPEPFEGRQIAIAMKGGSSARRDLASARALALARARSLDHAPADALDLEQARGLSRVLDRVLDLLADARALDRTLADALYYARALDRALAKPPPGRYVGYAGTCYVPGSYFMDQARTSALDFDLGLALGHALAGGPRSIPGGRLADARDGALKLKRCLAQDHAPAGGSLLLLAFLIGEPDDQRDHVATLIRARNRGLAFLWALYDEVKEWTERRPFGWASRRWRQMLARLDGNADPSEGRALIATGEKVVWDLHMAARLAHARINGADPPFEAIRIVRERVESKPASIPIT